MIDVVDDDGPLVRRDSASETLPDRDPRSLANLLLQTPRGRGHQILRGRVEQEHGRRVDTEQLPYPVEQLGQEALDTEMGQRCVGQRLDPAQPLGRAPRVLPR